MCQKVFSENLMTKTTSNPNKWKTAAKICVFLKLDKRKCFFFQYDPENFVNVQK